ncbi:MAG TPA: efflux RND transporter periplasmic adaptor subunit [Candidatus Latescibacteria bacterium]|nr:efflux RND transporter periplasmic adaptor subunit [Candidatus Handelsmanbacteria bacterium]HIL10772.1 efflux RND transporter periplasmic adaptor subunit [Candidatus Latescibacterota bacterium]
MVYMKESNYRTSVFAGWLVALMLVGSVGIRPGIAEVANKNPHVEEEGHDEDGHEEHQSEDVVRLHAEAIREFGIEIGEAGPGNLAKYTRLPGEVVIDPDRLVHVVPRVSGVARGVYKRLGDQVKRGDVLAELESRELAELKSTYLVARERFGLAEKTFTREEKLWRESISSERDYLAAEQNLAEQRIEMRAAEQKLHALGFPNAYLQVLTFDEDEYFTRYELRASLQGTVIEKHIALGEVIKDDAEAFVIADLNSVWVKLTVYQKDLSSVQPGQSVRISKEDGSTVTGKISYVSPVVDEVTRTAVARLELKNENGQWRPGSFVAGLVAVEAHSVPLLIRKSALQTIEGEMVVFVETPEGFEPQKVRVGRGNEVEVEIVAGLAAGQRYVVEGAFTLKAELAKGSFGDGHNH